MNQADLDRAERLTTQRQEYETLAYRYVCALCGSPLLVAFDGRKDIYEITCSKDSEHQGYERLKSLYQQWQAGMAMPVEVVQALEFKYGKKEKRDGPNN